MEKDNGIEYRFTIEEVEAVATLLRMSRESKSIIANNLASIITKAFNREAFKRM